MKNKRSRNSRAVVTGAGSGIGRAFALELARRGGEVVCADINLDAAKETVTLIDKAGGKGLATNVDVGDLAQVEQMAEDAEQWFGEPATLVINNAGVGVGGRAIGEIPIEDWHWALQVNLWGVVHGCHVFAPRLRQVGHGGIINVCSSASFAAAPGMGPYNAGKAAALAISETLAAELADTDIAVTALCPTWVKTNIVKDGRISAAGSKIASRLMDKVGMTPERVARETLDTLDKGRLYLMPQMDAKAIWRFKRLFPALYWRGAGMLDRLVRA